MGYKTSISWTESTWSPVRGCSRVSQGCVNCYAERLAGRFGQVRGGAFSATFSSSTDDGKYCWECNLKLINNPDALFTAYRKVHELRIEQEAFQEDFRERAAEARSHVMDELGRRRK